MTELAKRPKVKSDSEKELDKVEEQFKAHDEHVKSLTLDRMNTAPKEETEMQTKIANRDMDKHEMYLKPHRTISSREKFNEKFREEYNFRKEYVRFIAENKEIVGEDIDVWVKGFPGLPVEWWKVPVNKPVWAPRYVAERLKGCSYHRLRMDQSQQSGFDEKGNSYFGTMTVDTTVQRLDAHPVSDKKSIFMGASSF